MPILENYEQFAGRHWETGTVHNYLAHAGCAAPHTGQPYSEALLLGVSGGITVGYFTFAYKGHDPQVNILTRNTFDPWLTMLSRLGVVQDVVQTAGAARAEAKLIAVLEEGSPGIVQADVWSLPYNGLDGEGMWGAFPILVYGLEAGQAWVADRAAVPLQLSAEALGRARGRIKKERHRLITLAPPLPEKLASAVTLGITDCIKLFTETPPKGAAHNFGLAAYRHWAEMLTRPGARSSWAQSYRSGGALYAALTSAMQFGLLFGKGTALDGERGLYADFLEEAAGIVDRPVLLEAAARFRTAAVLWHDLGKALLPDEVPLLAEARRLQGARHLLFLERGQGALVEMQAADRHLAGLRAAADDALHPDTPDTADLLTTVADTLLQIHDVEKSAVTLMRQALGE